MTIRYRIIERIGGDPSEYVWHEVEAGVFTRMPRSYGPEPTLADADEYASRFNDDTCLFQYWEEPDERGA